MRSEVTTLAGRHVIIDCYNANPASMAAALRTLAELSGGPDKATATRGLAIVGDMLELGDHAEAAHGEVGRLAATLGLAVVALGGWKDVVAARHRGTGAHLGHRRSARGRAPGAGRERARRLDPGQGLARHAPRARDRRDAGGGRLVLFWLFHEVLSEHLSWLRVFRYPSMRILAAAITALLMSFLIGPWFIERLKSRQIGQQIREEGPQTHKKKAGTPTMGGSLILFCLVVSTLLWCDLRNKLVLLALFVTVVFGAIGFADDYAKVTKKNTKGVSGKLRLLLEFAVAGGAMAYLFYGGILPEETALRIQLPFTNYYESGLMLPAWLYCIFGALVVVGTANAVNLTDGLDGLAIGPSIMNAGTFLIFAYIAGVETVILTADGPQHLAAYLHIAHIPQATELAIFCAALFGAGIGFLWYNTYPAQVFMGDVGSLSIGGAIGMLAVLTKNEAVLLIVGGLFVVEALSVIIQVGSFKTRGKRVFRMAPIHHHYELKGWDEPKIIVRFWLISALLALMALGTLKLR